MKIDVEVKIPATQEFKGSTFNFAVVDKHQMVIALLGYEHDAKVLARSLQNECDWDRGLKIRRLVEK